MRRILRALAMALSMFTVIPCPRVIWDDESRGMMLACLPIVGALLGLVWAVLALLSRAVLPAALAAAFIAAQPYVLTGFIHLDGFMDTADALLSWRTLDERLEILKDSRAGAFAVAGTALLMMFGYAASQGQGDLRALVLIPVVSRCASALSVLTIRRLDHSEYAALVGSTAQRLTVAAIWLIAVVTGFIWLGHAAVALLAETLGYALAMAWAVRVLGGVSGDLAGFALTVSECFALIALSITGG